MKEETIIRISVRSLVEFILREGDIDNRVSGSMEKDAMLLGGKIHRKIRKLMLPLFSETDKFFSSEMKVGFTLNSKTLLRRNELYICS